MKSLLGLLSQVEEITMFGDGEIYLSQEYQEAEETVRQLRQKLLTQYGEDMDALLEQYTEAVEEKGDFAAEHYFEQGFLAGRRPGGPDVRRVGQD